MTGSPPSSPGSVPAQWQQDVELVKSKLLRRLAGRGVDTANLRWLSANEASSVLQLWARLGPRRYGTFALIPPPGVSAMRGEFSTGTLPKWLDTSPRTVLILFFQPSQGHLLAQCQLEFAIENLVALARADGDGFAAITAQLEGVLLVNAQEDLSDSVLEIEAWGNLCL
jgi:hypothetical protein